MGDRRDDCSEGLKLLCRKFNGQKGPAFTSWKKEYLDACEEKGDQDASYSMHYLGLAPAAGLTPAQVARRNTRQRESYGCLMRHIDDESLKATLRAQALRQGREAWQTLERECAEPTSALMVNAKILEWHSLTVAKDVGYNPGSIMSSTDF